MDPIISIGSELEELLLFPSNFNIANIAPLILGDPELQLPENRDRLTKEATHAQIEIHGARTGARTIRELYDDSVISLNLLERLCKRYGVVYAPACESGAGRGERNETNTRLPGYINVLGDEKLTELLTISGTHLHFSLVPGKELEQRQLLMALEPLSYAITSSSPIRYDGVNSDNCHRVNLIRNRVFEGLDHAQLLPYPRTEQELLEQSLMGWEEWLEHSGMSEKKLRKIGFAPDNTGYAAIRRRYNVCNTGVNTDELRMLDIGPIDVIMATAAFIKGILEYTLQGNPEIAIANMKDEKSMYQFSPDKITLPDLETRQYMQEQIIRNGAKPDIIRNSIAHLLPYAREGLPEEDQVFLRPLERVIETGINPADEIMLAMRQQGYQGHQFSSEQVPTAYEHAWQRNKQGLELLQGYVT